MRPRDAVVAVVFAAFPAASTAQTIDRSNRAASAPILQLTTVPRAAASGGALTAASGATRIFAHPAGAAAVRGRVTERLAVGASVQYLGGDVDVGGFAAPLPRTVRAGAELRPLGPEHERLHLLLAADFAAARGAPGQLGGGVEAGWSNPA